MVEKQERTHSQREVGRYGVKLGFGRSLPHVYLSLVQAVSGVLNGMAESLGQPKPNVLSRGIYF